MPWIKRLRLLESQIQGIQDNQGKLHAMMCEQGQQQQAQITVLQGQHVKLEKTVADGSANLVKFQQTFQNQLEQQQSQLDTLFQKQMDKIEDLFQKKARTS